MLKKNKFKKIKLEKYQILFPAVAVLIDFPTIQTNLLHHRRTQIMLCWQPQAV